MERLIDLAINRKRAVMLVLALILIAGMISYTSIPKENTPDVQIPIIYVSMTLEGISPEDAERMLIKPMEIELRNIEGLKEMRSTATQGFASVLLEFTAGFDKDKALADVREKVETAKSKLPQETDEPVVNEVNLSRFPVLNVILYGDLPERALLQIAKDLEDKVEAIPSVLDVNIAGDKEETIEIIVKPELLETYNLTSSIIELTSANNLLIAAGAIDNQDGKFQVKVPGLIENVKDILNLPVSSEGDNVTRIKDIAEVRKSFKDPTGFARVNGKPAIVLEVSKRTGENIIETIEKVKKVVEEENKLWPENLNVLFAQDQSDDIRTILLDLQNNIIAAVILVGIMTVASIGLRSSLLISVSLPGAFLIGILAIGMMGYTLNIVVLFSLIMAVGMLVDAATIVVEYANRKIDEGMSYKEAYDLAAKRMLWPVVSSTATVLIVFAPLLFWPGIVGEFMKYMPITLIVTLFGALLMALIFIPVLGTIVGKPDKISQESKDLAYILEQGDLNELRGFYRYYTKLLSYLVDHSKKFTLCIFGLMFLVIFLYGSLGKGVEFFPDIEPRNIQTLIRARGNLSTIEKDNIVKEVENAILALNKEIRVFYARSGTVSGQGGDFPEDTIGLITMEFVDWQERRTANEIMEDIRERTKDIPGVIIEVNKQEEGPAGGKSVNIEVASRFPELVEPAADMIIEKMSGDDRFIDITDTRSIPEIEWKIDVDRGQAAKFQVSMATLGNFVKLVTNGLVVTKYRPDNSDDEIDVVLRFPSEYRGLAQLDNLKVITDKGAIPISNFVSRTPNNKVGKIERVDGFRTIKIEANSKEGVLPDQLRNDARKWIEEAYKDGTLDQRVAINFKGEDEDQKEASQFLSYAFMLAIFSMFLMLSAQFNNFFHTFIIMSAIVLSTVGVFLALLLTGQPFGIVMCGVGVIALAGTVVSNNIIFIDTYVEMRKNGVELKEALVRTGASRLRPIYLTAGTTVLGLLPMVYMINIDFISREVTFGAPSMQWWTQLSTTIAGGMTFATIITLLYTPSMIYLGERFFGKIGRWRRRKDPAQIRDNITVKPVVQNVQKNEEPKKDQVITEDAINEIIS